MIKKCKGCGVELQNNDPKLLGYTPKMDAEYCQRCFRLTHYNDVMISMQKDIDNDALLEKVNKLDALVLWVVDLFDFEGSIINGINRHLIGKDIILVATKRDLLPRSVGNPKIINFIMHRLKNYGINILGAIITTNLVSGNKNPDNHSIDEINKAIDLYRDGRDVVVIGSANAGKSTLLNAFLNDKVLTTSYHPGTSIDLNPIKMEDYTLYDTPGLVKKDSMLTHINDKYLKQIIPFDEINPIKYQLKGNQSLALGGLARLDIEGCENVTCVCYFSKMLNIHRSKMENADNLWNTHLNEMLKPCIVDRFDDMKVYQSKAIDNRTDVVINGLGWFCIIGKFKQVSIYVDENSGITFREGMI